MKEKQDIQNFLGEVLYWMQFNDYKIFSRLDDLIMVKFSDAFWISPATITIPPKRTCNILKMNQPGFR